MCCSTSACLCLCFTECKYWHAIAWCCLSHSASSVSARASMFKSKVGSATRDALRAILAAARCLSDRIHFSRSLGSACVPSHTPGPGCSEDEHSDASHSPEDDIARGGASVRKKPRNPPRLLTSGSCSGKAVGAAAVAAAAAAAAARDASFVEARSMKP